MGPRFRVFSWTAFHPITRILSNVVTESDNGILISGDRNLVEDNLLNSNAGCGLWFPGGTTANVYRGNVARGAAQGAALEKVPYAELLLTVPQLGSVTVATILGETGDLRHYKNAEMVIKMAGYNP